MTEAEKKEYLTRIGYEGEPTVSKSCLETLMKLHLQKVPFENLESYEEGKVPSLESRDIYEKIVLRKRGGYCFELNKLFYELLKAVGFQVIPVGVRILWKKEKLPPMLHRGTLVSLADGTYYCDVGYGGPGPKYPVKLEDGIHEEKDGKFRVIMKPEETNGEVLIERWKQEQYLPILRFSMHPALEADFELMNFYCAKSPDTMFTQKRILSRNLSCGSVALTGNVLTMQYDDGSMDCLKTSSDEIIREWIQTYFDIQE